MSEAMKVKPQTEVKLVIQKGPHAGQRFSFSKKEVTIGRAPENDIVLMNDPLISRQHAKVIVVGNDVEIINLSEKNSIIVQGESVQKWKLVNSGTFMVGDTEFQILFDLGQSVIPVRPQAHLQVLKSTSTSEIPAVGKKNPTIVPIKQNSPPPQVKSKIAPVNSQQQALQLQQRQIQNQQLAQQKVMPNRQQHVYNQTQFQAGVSGRPAKQAASQFRLYIILAAIVGLGFYFFGLPQKKTQKSEEKKTILKYADEVQIKLNSKSEKENQKKIEKLYEMRNSPMALRAQENFIKGMRDYQLGNYTRAQESFQVVLNLQPGHELAKRHLYLSKVRFDEVLKAKLMLGESYYQKHNFKMCQSMYEQVLNMLQGKSSDQNFQIASAMIDKCRLASEGVQ
jgi:hypothetical protein